MGQCMIFVYMYLVSLLKQYLVLLKYFRIECNSNIVEILFSIIHRIYNSYVVNFFLMFKKSFIYEKKHFISCRYLSCKSHLNSTFCNSLKLNSECKLCNIKDLSYKNRILICHDNNCQKSHELIHKDHLIMNDIKSSINTPQQIDNNKLSLQKIANLLPSIDLLLIPSCSMKECVDMNILKQKSALLESKLADYHVQAQVVNILQGPVVTRFELNLAPSLKSARISSLSRDLARSLSVCSLQVIEVIPDKPYVGIEIPNKHRKIVCLREVLDTTQFRSSCNVLTFGLGKDVSDEPIIANLTNMPHLLIAGTTGSGKSVGINSIIISILYKATPEDVRFIMIDPRIINL